MPTQAAAAEEPGDVAEGEVLAHVHRADRAAYAALGRHERDAGVDRLARSMADDRRAVEGHVATVSRDLAGDQPEDVLPPRAGDPGDADDLPGRDVEVDAVDGVASQAPHGEERRRGGAGIARIRGFERVADDQLDEPVVVELADGHGRDLPSVAEHGDAVGEFEHLVEVVGDVQDRDPTRSQAVDHLEQTLDVLARQRRRRLVEDQQAGTVLPTDECSGDGDRRAVRLRQ